MASAQQGSNEIAKGKGCKTDKTRRSWSTKEEEILLASLKELVVLGWKADNGFKAGYLHKLEEAMRKEFPDTDIKGMPHINSKLGAWKRNYNSLCLILDKTGVGFNSKGTFMIDCNNEQWEQIVVADKNAGTMRFKSWPMFEGWQEVFGKDRANGKAAEDVMEALNEMYQADSIGGSNHGTQLDEEGENNYVGDSVCQSDGSAATAKVSKKKRKARDEMEPVLMMLGEINKNTGARIDNLSTRVGYEWDLGKARQTVYEQLGKIPGLSMTDKFNICEILADKVQRLEIFIGLPEEAKSEYVAHLLNTKKE